MFNFFLFILSFLLELPTRETERPPANGRNQEEARDFEFFDTLPNHLNGHEEVVDLPDEWLQLPAPQMSRILSHINIGEVRGPGYFFYPGIGDYFWFVTTGIRVRPAVPVAEIQEGRRLFRPRDPPAPLRRPHNPPR
ncbi:uncharacterized protein LOC107272966 [Cephus cinctus]|uniref:Uncharacterized protein LOC107272966 n=1 Tax=Cephus cinctus TaxID=211228 RepID=A0AAJ7FSK6_CEPCN|nr:uncharacterized protein LOC107272966 [Cephus cinctus]